jgi:hypothetical protein
LKEGREKLPGRPSLDVKEQEQKRLEDALYCKFCGRAITSRLQELTVNGSLCHTFFNPAGIVFELGCYKTAPGCSVVGTPTSEFSWFKGYFWTFALCRGCGSHLGWFFDSGDTAFWGLILNKLKE